MKNYFDMCAAKTANIGDVVCLRAYSRDNLDNDGIDEFSFPQWRFTVTDISPTYDVTCLWIAPSGEVHKYTFHALMLDFLWG